MLRNMIGSPPIFFFEACKRTKKAIESLHPCNGVTAVEFDGGAVELRPIVMENN